MAELSALEAYNARQRAEVLPAAPAPYYCRHPVQPRLTHVAHCAAYYRNAALTANKPYHNSHEGFTARAALYARLAAEPHAIDYHEWLNPAPKPKAPTAQPVNTASQEK